MKMTRRLLIFLFVVAVLALPLTALADDGVNATMVVGQSEIAVGDVVPLQVTVTHPQGWRVLFPTLEKTWGDLEVRSQGAPEISENSDGSETTTQVIQVARFRPGEVVTPEMALTVADAQGTVQTLNVQPVTLEVKSVLQENDTTLRDIKPQAELWQFSSSPLPFVGSLALAFTMLGGVAMWAWKRRPIADKRSPRERALDDLKAIEAANYFASDDLKLYCVRVSITLREYLQKGSNLPATEMTTGELAQTMKQTQLPANIAAQIIQVLRVCDTVKFANDVSDVDAIKALGNVTQQIVMTYPPAQTPNEPKREVTK